MGEKIMFKEQMNKIKSLIKVNNDNGEEGIKEKPNKRKIENLVVFLIILIITLIAINTILGKGKDKKSDQTEQSAYKVLAEYQDNKNETYDDELEKRLENILETMVGVRKSTCTNYIH